MHLGFTKTTPHAASDENVIETKLYDHVNSQFYSYTKVQWSLHIRKEVIKVER